MVGAGTSITVPVVTVTARCPGRSQLHHREALTDCSSTMAKPQEALPESEERNAGKQPRRKNQHAKLTKMPSPSPLRNPSYALITLSVAIVAYLALPFIPPAPNMAPLQRITARFLPQAAYLPQLLKPLASSTIVSFSSSLPTIPSSISFPSPSRNFATTSPTMSSYDKTSLKDAVAARRTVYQLNKTAPVDDKKIQAIVEQAVHDVPSTFNSQSTRLVVLLKDEHDKFWDIVLDALKAIVPADKLEGTAGRIAGFRAAYGTVLFYEAPEPTKKLQTNLPEYADKFPVWAEHTSAMHQYTIWTALHAEGFGANLQHYNPLPDQQAAATWKIPLEWSLKAQLVFGGREAGWEGKLPEKTQQPLSERLFVHGA
nr:putative nitroreductase hbn1 [Quercus suber]